MQACPYDALYIDPETHTAAKCNYCAHRIDIGLEPACVNVCPVEAIISGDMDNPETQISQLLSMQQVKVRKIEKGTQPNLFYIDADDASLIPTATEKSNDYFMNSQSRGVGHFAKEAERLAYSNGDVVAQLIKAEDEIDKAKSKRKPKTVEVLMDHTKRIYDAPDKGILWGWEVSAYVWTKGIASGSFLMTFLFWLLRPGLFEAVPIKIILIVGLVFLGITGLLLVKDLDRPDRFLYVLFRPQWKSWLVKGAYAITVYGALLSLILLSYFLDFDVINKVSMWITAIFAVVTAIYTAFLFGQAKGRDFWQSPTLSIHMLVHSVLAGASVMGIINWINGGELIHAFLTTTLLSCLVINMFILVIELFTTHPTNDTKITVDSIVRGRYKLLFWFGVIFIGNLLPVALILMGITGAMPVISLLVLIGIYITEHIWVEAPQRIPLS